MISFPNFRAARQPAIFAHTQIRCASSKDTHSGVPKEARLTLHLYFQLLFYRQIEKSNAFFTHLVEQRLIYSRVLNSLETNTQQCVAKLDQELRFGGWTPCKRQIENGDLFKGHTLRSR